MLLGNGAEHKTRCNWLVYSSAESQGNLQGRSLCQEEHRSENSELKIGQYRTPNYASHFGSMFWYLEPKYGCG